MSTVEVKGVVPSGGKEISTGPVGAATPALERGCWDELCRSLCLLGWFSLRGSCVCKLSSPRLERSLGFFSLMSVDGNTNKGFSSSYKL